MGRIAFYAPLKSPNHTVPSGEREIARNLMRVLSTDDAQPVLASELRSLDKQGSTAHQAQLIQQAQGEAETLIARGCREGWQAWVTYHNYYKAPDLLGPTVSKALGIPYLLVEATLASKRLGGPWDTFERRALAACEAADAIFNFTERDAMALRAALGVEKLVGLSPFLAMETLPEPASAQTQNVFMAGMMRAGDKLSSYQIAAEALRHMGNAPWQLEIAGDGPMRSEVAKMMAPFGDRVRFLGALDAAGMAAAYGRARVFFWPGVNEAFGMVYLEAQAHGVPVAAEDRAGVNEVVEAGGLIAQGAPDQLAKALGRVLSDVAHHRLRSEAARTLVQSRHLLPAARKTIWGALHPLMKERS
ncbi:glycosyltransferase family 4 protein [Shimia sp. R9_2]|uniref:glycosyltransferase family 4 protein n=1 Tax=Shimia sp. R9_2 TaxID=2821112 RepID=UPI001ADD3474|nr:glycosyltransferase family 4 protein [Shimia sp. R9_2]MBO9395519.1 glycosyltransferase family 4 protein [Shimia sp. R9_2]